MRSLKHAAGLALMIGVFAPGVPGPSAHADVVIYTSQAAFLNPNVVFQNYYLETFNALSPGTIGTSLGANSPPYSYSITGGPSNPLVAITNPNDPGGGGPTDQWLTTQNSGPITFTFNAGALPITAIGGYLFPTTLGNPVAGSVTFTATSAAGTFTQTINYPIGSNVNFFGITWVNTPITTLVVTPGSGTTFSTVNDFIVGTAVPEPPVTALAALMVGGTLGLRAFRRRRAGAGTAG